MAAVEQQRRLHTTVPEEGAADHIVPRILQNKSDHFQYKFIIYQGQFHIISAFQYDKIEIKALDKGILPILHVTHRIVGPKAAAEKRENWHI